VKEPGTRGSVARGDRILVAALVAFVVFFRLATLMMIHTGVDERDYWYSAKCVALGLPYPELTHRTVRFAVILPVAAAQLVFGESPNVYYVMPIFNAALQAALAYMIGRRLRGRLAGFLAALALVLFPYMIRAGSQVRPETFSISYVLAALWCFLAYMDRAERGARSGACLVGSAAFLFAAYEANVTNLFFAPGLVVLILLRKRPLREALAFCGILIGLFLAETALYALLTDYKLGQLQVIAQSHLESNGSLQPLKGPAELFLRYVHPNLQTYWQASFVAFAAAAIYLLARKGERGGRTLVVAALSYFLCMTFAVKSFRPLVPAEPFINRYFCAVLGPIFLVLSATVADLLARLGRGKGARGASRSPGAGVYVSLLALGAALIVAVFSSDILPKGTRQYAHSILRPSEHPLALNVRYREAADKAWEGGTPIVAAEGTAGDNAIEACSSFFLSPSHFADGVRPQARRVEAEGKGYLVLASSPDPDLSGPLLAAARQPFRLRQIDSSRLPELSGDRLPGE
jgi:hypothetical protein